MKKMGTTDEFDELPCAEKTPLEALTESRETLDSLREPFRAHAAQLNLMKAKLEVGQMNVMKAKLETGQLDVMKSKLEIGQLDAKDSKAGIAAVEQSGLDAPKPNLGITAFEQSGLNALKPKLAFAEMQKFSAATTKPMGALAEMHRLSDALATSLEPFTCSAIESKVLISSQVLSPAIVEAVAPGVFALGMDVKSPALQAFSAGCRLVSDIENAYLATAKMESNISQALGGTLHITDSPVWQMMHQLKESLSSYSSPIVRESPLLAALDFIEKRPIRSILDALDGSSFQDALSLILNDVSEESGALALVRSAEIVADCYEEQANEDPIGSMVRAARSVLEKAARCEIGLSNVVSLIGVLLAVFFGIYGLVADAKSEQRVLAALEDSAERCLMATNQSEMRLHDRLDMSQAELVSITDMMLRLTTQHRPDDAAVSHIAIRTLQTRSGAGSEFAVVGEIAIGQMLFAIETVGDWTRVAQLDSSGMTVIAGWVDTHQLIAVRGYDRTAPANECMNQADLGE